MKGSIFGRMVRKDLYLNRFSMLGATVLGIATIAVAPLSRTAFYVGGVSFLCVLILLNVLTVMLSIAHEKKEKVHLFALSLPISTAEYAASKVVASLLAFLMPLALIIAASVAVITHSDLPDGLIPYAAAIEAYMFFYFAVFLGVALHTDSGLWHSVVIVLGNISVSFVMPLIHNLPGVAENTASERIVWSPELVGFIACEVGLGLLVLAFFFVLTLRKKDFV